VLDPLLFHWRSGTSFTAAAANRLWILERDWKLRIPRSGIISRSPSHLLDLSFCTINGYHCIASCLTARKIYRCFNAISYRMTRKLWRCTSRRIAPRITLHRAASWLHRKTNSLNRKETPNALHRFCQEKPSPSLLCAREAPKIFRCS